MVTLDLQVGFAVTDYSKFDSFNAVCGRLLGMTLLLEYEKVYWVARVFVGSLCGFRCYVGRA